MVARTRERMTHLIALAITFCWIGHALGCKTASSNGAPEDAAISAPAEKARILEMTGAAYDWPDRPLTIRKDSATFTQKSTAIVGAKDFVFVLSQGSAFDGKNVLDVDAHGGATFVFGKNGAMFRAAFVLSPEQLEALQKELAAIDVFALDAHYVDEAVRDGTLWGLQVQAAGQRKTVGCGNAFPSAMVRLSRFVRLRIIDAHESAISNAVVLKGVDRPYHPPNRW